MTQNWAVARKFDAIVVGAGPNGLAMALALGHESARVLLVDTRDALSFASPSRDNRGTALTRATQNMFKALGCWNAIQPHAADMRDVIVTDGSGSNENRPVLLSFTTAPDYKPAAAIVENRHLATALMEALQKSADVTLWTSCKGAAVQRATGYVGIEFEDGRNAKAPLLIGADGRNSFVRQEAGITVTSHDDGQVALTFSISHDLPHGHRAEEHFSATGVFALLPLPGNCASIVWGTTPEGATRLMAMADAEFEDELNERLGSRLGRARVEGGRQAYPLRRQVASALTAERTALVGDAAHTIHPLAGLGLNLGFKDVAILAECVSNALKRGEDIGGASLLGAYETWRRFDIVSTVAAMEGMNGLFVNEWPFLKTLRQVGLRAVDASPSLKSAIMAEASGLNGALPRLMRTV